jgi:hypothetical protein
MTTKTELLETAKLAVADRGLNYGRPEANFERIAALWTAHIRNRYADPANSEVDMSTWDGRFDPSDVAQMMVLMKIARLENSPHHLDSWVDVAGYAACGAELAPSDSS